jgi:hypothetical protein
MDVDIEGSMPPDSDSEERDENVVSVDPVIKFPGEESPSEMDTFTPDTDGDVEKTVSSGEVETTERDAVVDDTTESDEISSSQSQHKGTGRKALSAEAFATLCEQMRTWFIHRIAPGENARARGKFVHAAKRYFVDDDNVLRFRIANLKEGGMYFCRSFYLFLSDFSQTLGVVLCNSVVTFMSFCRRYVATLRARCRGTTTPAADIPRWTDRFSEADWWTPRLSVLASHYGSKILLAASLRGL